MQKNVLDEIGGFDDDYFIYVEESDLCWRIWLQEYRVVLTPDSIVYHKFGTSSIVLPERINCHVKFHETKNYISTLIRNLEFKNLLKTLTMHITLWLGIALFFLLKRQCKSTKWILQGIFWNFANHRNLMKKRKIVQKQRMVTDKEIFPKIMKKKSFKYFARKLESREKIGHGSG